MHKNVSNQYIMHIYRTYIWNPEPRSIKSYFSNFTVEQIKVAKTLKQNMDLTSSSLFIVLYQKVNGLERKNFHHREEQKVWYGK